MTKAELLEMLADETVGNTVTRNGGTKRVNSKRKAMTAISLDELRQGNAPRESNSDVVPDHAMVTVVNGREYAIYPSAFEGIRGVKCTFMPFKKQFLSMDTVRMLANEDIQVLLAEFVTAVDGKK